MANAERFRQMAEIVKSQLEKRPVLVLSAMGDTTDHLLEAADNALKKGIVKLDKIVDLHIKTIDDLNLGSGVKAQIQPLFDELNTLLMGISLIKELTGRTKDYLVSFGERFSVRIGAVYFNSIGIKAMAVDAWDGGFISDSNFTQAELIPEAWNLIPSRLLAAAEEGILQIVTGFIAKDEKGNITTLGRGGSDLTATMIGASCGASEIQVWKDVDGILTADPRLVETARVVETVTYEAASELAYYGAQVLHPRAMQPCLKSGTPVLVKNSYNPSAPGTKIVKNLPGKESPLQAITSRKNVTLVDIVSSRMLGQHGFLAGVFSSFAKYGISVDMVATSEVSVSITLDASYDLEDIKNELSQIASVDIKTGKAIVTIIGDVKRSSEILSRTFKICRDLGVQVQMISQGASKVNISFIVNDKEAPDIVKALHKDFFE